MKHEVNLSLYNMRTDLTIETIKNNNIQDVDVQERTVNDLKVTEVNIDTHSSKILNKKVGKYVTIEFEDVTDSDNRLQVIKTFTEELSHFINLNSKDDLILVIGLGNDNSTPDSLGPLTISDIVVTNHLYELDILDTRYSRVAAMTPSVTGKTGIETSKIIKSVVKAIKPSLIIVIDSLASSSIKRLNKTIQITDTGISPGSGIGNKRKEISAKTLHIPVIAIGVPTVVDATNIVYDTISYVWQNYANDNENLMGVMGQLSSVELKQLFSDVLTKEGIDLVVTPTEIDYLIECLGQVVSTGINNVLKNTF